VTKFPSLIPFNHPLVPSRPMSRDEFEEAKRKMYASLEASLAEFNQVGPVDDRPRHERRRADRVARKQK
jgi:hypothetical protein